MNSWCESCARKSCCYTMEIRPKCYLPTTNTAQGTPESYLAKALRYSRDSHEIAEQTEPQTYITEDRDTQILDAWQVHHRTSTTAVEDEPQTEVKGSERWLKSSEQSDAPTLTASGWKRIKEAMPECRLVLFDDDGNYIEPQTERSE